MDVLAIEHIVRDPQGKPRIAGSGIKVRVMVEWIQAGMTPEEIAPQHDLALGQIHAALSYYTDHQAEMDREIADLRALSDEVARSATTMDALRKRTEGRRGTK